VESIQTQLKDTEATHRVTLQIV